MAKPRKKKKKEDGGDPSVVLFTALGLILVAFFIMLNNIATLDSARSRAAIDSLIGTFGVLPGFRADGAGQMPRPRTEAPDDEISVVEQVSDLLREHQITGAYAELRDDGRVVIRFDQELLFESSGSRISPRYFPVLDDLGELMAEMNYPVIIEGHTDATPAGGGQSNWFFSAARASAVHRYLEGTAAVPPSMISTVGYADARPRADLGAATDPVQRRVEVVILPQRNL